MNLPPLPIVHSLPQLQKELQKSSVVLTAPPGSGKTTIVPLALLDEPWIGTKKIIILQPRRVAARAACFRMASILNEKPGKTVGYQIRHDRVISTETRIEVVTEGILTRRIQNDPDLKDIGLIIFDEFHERSIHADLALALCLDLSQINEELKILVMSATLETKSVSRLLGDAPVVKADGRCHEVNIEYSSQNSKDRIAAVVSNGVIKVLKEQEGDILVFLPGVGDILSTEKLLKTKQECKHISIQTLYGNLSQKAQDSVLYPTSLSQRRVILATSVAETSLTIEGISNVVDSGWSKCPYFNPANGLTSLKTIRVSKSSADQRAGRAGRLGPGYCLRLWNKNTHHSLPSFHPPEIVSSDLSQLVLELLLWGVTDPSDLLWLDPPRNSSYTNAITLLETLGAVDKSKQLTTLGKQLAQQPLHPRLGHLLIKAEQMGITQLAADICALLTEKDIMDYRNTSSTEITLRLDLLEIFRAKQPHHVFQKGGRSDHCRRVNQTSKLFKRKSPTLSQNNANVSVASLLIYAYPDRIAKRLPHQFGRYLLANGRIARLNQSDPLNHSEYLIIANMDGGEKEGHIYLAEPVSLSELREEHSQLVHVQEIIQWDQTKGKIETTSREHIGAITLQETQLHHVNEECITNAIVKGIQKNGLELLNWKGKASQLQSRVKILSDNQPKTPWPDLSGSHLAKNLDWLKPYLQGVRNIQQLKQLNLYEILLAQMDYKLQQKLRCDAPEHVTVPSGSRIRINYEDGTPPILPVRVQELFGLTITPAICGGRLPLLLHLLSPARRPIQITSDLEGFWKNSYHDVKKDLRGRYPKHYWPDDPAQAIATKTTKRKTERSK